MQTTELGPRRSQLRLEPCQNAAKQRRPRDSRERTVPIGTPRTWEVSSLGIAASTRRANTMFEAITKQAVRKAACGDHRALGLVVVSFASGRQTRAQCFRTDAFVG
jgi:hypothetical protein